MSDRTAFLVVILIATIHALDAIAQEMKNAVHCSRVEDVDRISGPQTSRVNRLNIPASTVAATLG